MQGKGLDFDRVLDVRAMRVIVASVPDCYAALSRVHELMPPVADEFDDYIARPKPNGYQSLHTVVLDDSGRPVEVQIRTQAMHDHAEHGVAAHWAYKEAGVKNSSQAVKAGGEFDDKVALLRQLLAWRDEVSHEGQPAALATSPATRSPDWHKATSAARLDDVIYVLTPQGRVVDLPRGATAIDLAYTLHTDLGHHCRGARVDGAMVPLDTPLDTGQTVEILNTDAEGRVILCDALAEADAESPDLLIDCATLTGAARAALGPDLPALFCNDDTLAARLRRAPVRVVRPTPALASTARPLRAAA